MDLDNQLILAAKENDVSEVKRLLEAGANTDASNFWGTAIIAAARRGHCQVAELLLASGANVNEEVHGRPPLFHAAENGHIEVVTLLLSAGAKMQFEDAPLRWDGWMGVVNVAIALSSHRAMVDTPDHEGKLALLEMARCGYSKVVKKLLDVSVNIEATDESGQSALMLASEYRHAETAQILLDYGAEVNAVDAIGRSALLYAQLEDGVSRGYSYNCNSTMTELLLNSGADVSLSSKKGITPLMEAIDSNCALCVSKLIEAGADVNAMDCDGDAVLHKGAARGSSCIDLLLKAGAKFDPLSNDALHAWMSACSIEGPDEGFDGYEPEKVVKLLLAAGLDVDVMDYKSYTGLLHCVDNEFIHRDILDVLLQAGADTNQANKDGDTALSVTKEKGRSDIVQLLESYSSD